MTEYICPTCHQEAEKPPWLVAREAGFQEPRHCTILANRLGKVTPCWGFRNRGVQVCAVECPIWGRFTKVIVERGRERRVWSEVSAS